MNSAPQCELASQLKRCWQNLRGYHDFRPYSRRALTAQGRFRGGVPQLNPTLADLPARQPVGPSRPSSRPCSAEPRKGRPSFKCPAADLGVKIGVFDPLENRRRGGKLATTSARLRPPTQGPGGGLRALSGVRNWVGWADGEMVSESAG